MVFEVQGKQNPISATLTNQLWYRASNLSSPIYQYGIDGRPFVHNRSYAWYARALEGKKEVSRSDIGQFIWTNCNTTGSNPTTSTDSTQIQNRKKKGVQYFLMPDFDEREAIIVKTSALHINYISDYPGQVLMVLHDATGAKLAEKVITVNGGHNYISLSPNEWKMRPAALHRLSILNLSGQIKTLPFWYKS